jgi:NADPH:quinone reductase-like Zn-dependent oxidoreductase
VQIAKSFGAEVTGVCSTRNMDMVRSIGADHVMDYTQEDFTKTGQRYDLFFDCFANHSLSACGRVLNSKGIHISVGGPVGSSIGILASWITALVLSRLVRRKFVTFMARSSKEDLTIMQELMKAGKVIPVIDRCYTLSEVPEAIRYLEEGHARGKVIITF